MSIKGKTEKNDAIRSMCSFININTGDSEFEGDIKFIGQLQTSPNPPEDKPEPFYGKRIAEIREHIHRQMSEKGHRPKKLLDWWNLVKDVSGAMSTMDFNFNFKNAVQPGAQIFSQKMNYSFTQCSATPRAMISKKNSRNSKN